MIQKIRHVSYRPSEFLEGITGHRLGVDGAGVYWIVCSILYARGETTAPESFLIEKVKAVSGSHGHTVKACFERLIEAGKLSIVDGQISAKGVANELENAAKRIAKHQQRRVKTPPNAPQNERDFKENNDLGANDSGDIRDTTNNQKPVTSNQKPESSLRSVPADLEEARELWNAMARRAGLPIAQRLTEQRSKRLRVRLDELAGLEGWQAMLAKVEASRFLTGKVPGRDGQTSFRADFDFVLQAQSLQRLMEGKYDDHKPAATRPERNVSHADPEIRDADMLGILEGLGIDRVSRAGPIDPGEIGA
jgi:hypothetical protein